MTAKIWPTMALAMKAAAKTATAPLVWDPVSHLQSRFSFGPTPTGSDYIRKNGPDAWYAWQLRVAKAYPGYTGNANVAKQGPLLNLSPYDVRQWLIGQGYEYGWTAMNQLTSVTLGLQAWSVAQLQEVLVDFFSNHLNVPNHNGDVWTTRHAYDRDVIRRNAMGSFTTMLLASAKHPAMLTYLNLKDSTKAAVNENYGRELLELHTVGLRYSESDVKNAARLLTGRTLDDNQHYLFDDYIHATGKVTILGFSDNNAVATAGEAAGDNMLRYLASHPYTAQHLAQKLCTRFVSDTPSSDLVNAVAAAYLAGRTQIMPMVSTILRSAEFWQSRGSKVRRPAENLIATVRVLGTTVSSWKDALDTLTWVSDNMGNCPLDWSAPNGYPDVAAAWRSSGNLINMWDAHLAITAGWWGGMRAADVTSMYRGARTSGEAVDLMTRRLTGMSWSGTHRAALQKFLAEPAGTAIASSRLQWYDVVLASIILHAPHHALR